MNKDPIVSPRLHDVDDAWPIDVAEQLQRFEARHRSAVRGGIISAPSSTRRKRVLAGTVAFAVFLLGGVLAWRAFHGVGAPTPAVTQSSPGAIDASISTFDTGLRFLEGAVVADGSVWVAGSNGNSELGQLVRIDPATGDVLARIDVPVPGWEFGGAGLAAARGNVWILTGPSARLSDQAAQRGSWVYRIDPATNSVADSVRIDGQDAADLWVDDTGIWVLSWAGSDSMTVSRLDPDTYAVLSITSVRTSWSQTVAHAGGNVWVFGSTQDDAPAETLFGLDPQTLAPVERTQPTNGSSFFLTVSGDRIWFFHDGLRALDASTGQQDIGPIGHDSQDCCANLTADGAGGVWVVDPSGSRPGLWHADAAGAIDVVDEAPLGLKVDGIASAYDPDTNSIWIVRYDGAITRIEVKPSNG